MRRGVQLLAYADRLGGDIDSLAALMRGPLSDLTGVHVLPFYTPFDGADAGFDPTDHTEVDPRLGTWESMAGLAAEGEVTADLIVNHTAAEAPQFRDWCERGAESAYAGMYLTFADVFPDGAREADLAAFYRPRPGLPVTPYTVAGEHRLVWTTFMPSQVDLDVTSPAALAYIDSIASRLAVAGIQVVRLDAVGYAIKTPGSDSFMTEHTLAFVSTLTERLRAAGLRVLVEVHAHYELQQAIAPLVDLVYDFALAGTLLHALGEGDVSPLVRWLEIRPENAVTVLDTHDGIGIIDAGPASGREGLLTEADMAAIFARAAEATGGHSTQASVVPQWASMPHQINATFPSVIDDDEAYVLCRAVQVLLPGEPQVYYVGLLNGGDDRERFAATGQGREVNRHSYTQPEFHEALDGSVTQAILALARIRRDHPALDGEFTFSRASATAVTLAWTAGASSLTLAADFAPGARRVHLVDAMGDRSAEYTSAAELARWVPLDVA